jgi:cell division protein FtsN
MVDNEDRGTYSPPTEDHLAYESRRTPAREQAPITLIVSGIFLVILLIAVVLFYNTNISQRKSVPEVGTDLGDYKDTQVQEAKPLTDQDLAGVTGLNDPSVTQLAPKTEVPDARTQNSADAGASAPLIRDVPLGQTPTQPIITEPARPAAKPASSASASPVAALTPAASGSASVQIGAFGSKEAADSQYDKVASNYGLFLDGTAKRVEKVDVNGTAFYRTSFVGFASKDKAKAFCQALKASGRDCIVK